MKYGIYYAYWEKQWGADYTKYVAKAAGVGFDILEISCAGLKDMTSGQIEDLRRYKEAYGIQLTGGYGPKAGENIASSDPAVVKNALDFWKQTFCVLQKLDIHLVGGGLYSYWPADYGSVPDKSGDMDRSIRNMRTLASMAEDFGITLCMESLNRHEGYLINTARECVDYVESVGAKNVKVMLDTYHMNMEEDSFKEAILTAGPLLGHLHVGENNRRLPGQGRIIPWQEIGEALREISFQGTVVMEPFVIHGGQVGQDIRIWRDLLDDTSQERLDRDAEKSVQFLRGIFEIF
ncbi:MAG TPA: sugar phosphate isomerase/epimerase family protein [Anaerovoracaceae bacterium]|nr:sugar phosphate isomerase/epimerase family protein [Anaerovoracaceae bacterium]